MILPYKYEFIYNGGNPGQVEVCILYVNDQKVGEDNSKTQPFQYSADEGVNACRDGETDVSSDYNEGDTQFAGRFINIWRTLASQNKRQIGQKIKDIEK